ncbi:MAG: Na/Pi cotransporter family protein [Kiritimatiellia bacterium]
MTFEQILEIASGIIGGLCIFLLGMRYMSDGMQAVAGNRLRRMIATVTDNRFKACATGAAVTCLIQSSSVTAVMAISMVNIGVMTLKQSIGVLLGADIGTTITAWIVALHVTQHGLIILGVSGFLYLFSGNERIKFTAMFFLGIGMIFFGLTLMKNGMDPLSTSEGFRAWFCRFSADDYSGLFKCVLVGSVTTALMQSSSATIAITILLATSKVIGFHTAVALVLGQNIGTTITAYLAALGTSTASKRTAFAHILIKVFGVAIVFPFFYLFLDLLENIMPTAIEGDVGKQIAFSHTIFNAIIVLLFLPVTGVLVKLLVLIIPTRQKKEVQRLIYLDAGRTETPSIAIQESGNAILKMRDSVDQMMVWLGSELEKPNENQEQRERLIRREEILDVMQKEIVEFITRILQKNLPLKVITEARQQLRIADEYESISDYAVTLLKLNDRLAALNPCICPQDMANIKTIHAKVCNYLKSVGEALAADDAHMLIATHSEGSRITDRAKQFREEHLSRIEHAGTSPLQTLVIIDILQSYRKIRAHALNIAEAAAGEK